MPNRSTTFFISFIFAMPWILLKLRILCLYEASRTITPNSFRVPSFDIHFFWLWLNLKCLLTWPDIKNVTIIVVAIFLSCPSWLYKIHLLHPRFSIRLSFLPWPFTCSPDFDTISCHLSFSRLLTCAVWKWIYICIRRLINIFVSHINSALAF